MILRAPVIAPARPSTAARAAGMGALGVGFLRQLTARTLPAGERAEIEGAVRQLPTYARIWGDNVALLERAEARGATDATRRFRAILDDFGGTITGFDRKVRAAVADARADGETIQAADSYYNPDATRAGTGLGVLPLIVVAVAAAALGTVFIYMVTSEWGRTEKHAATLAHARSLETQLRAIQAFKDGNRLDLIAGVVNPASPSNPRDSAAGIGAALGSAGTILALGVVGLLFLGGRRRA